MYRSKPSFSPVLLFSLLFLAFAFVVFLAGPAFAGSENGKKVGHHKDDVEVTTEVETTDEIDEATAPAESGTTRSGTGAGSGETEASSKKSPAVATQDAGGATATTTSKGTTSKGSTAGTTTTATSNQGGSPTHGCAQAAENDGDPYDSTCDGTPAMNGGKIHKNHCGGCVGAADNKNPPGQMPDGSDHNNGYECDGNNGVGKTNPAHSGCKPPPPPPPPCVDNPNTPMDECKPPPPPPPPCVDNPNTPRDECNPVPPPPQRPPDVVEGVIIPKFERGPSVRGNPPPPALPFTGAPTTPFVLMGLLMVAAGGSLLRFSGRRRRHA